MPSEPADAEEIEVDLDRARYETLIDRLGEDPARYLDHDLLDGECRELLEARLRGLRCRETLEAFRAVERNLGRGAGGGPRSGVMDLLDEAEQRIDEHGELDLDPDVAPIEERVDGDHPGIRERFRELVDSRALDTTVGSGDALASARQQDTTEQAGLGGFSADAGNTEDDSADEAVATDGGETA